MAREREIVGIVRPSVDSRSLERDVERPMQRSMDEVSNITPSLNTRKLKRQLGNILPGGIGSGLGGGRSGGGVGGGKSTMDVQVAQLSVLKDIKQHIEKGNLTRARSGGGGGAGLGIMGILGTVASGLGTALGFGALATAGAAGMFEGFRNMGGMENLDRLLSGDWEQGSKLPSMEEFAGTGISMLGGPIGMLFSEEITGMLEGLDLPALQAPDWLQDLDLSVPDWLEGVDLDVPDWLEGVDLSVPDWLDDVALDTPDWLQDLDIGVPDWLQNIRLDVPGWLRELARRTGVDTSTDFESPSSFGASDFGVDPETGKFQRGTFTSTQSGDDGSNRARGSGGGADVTTNVTVEGPSLTEEEVRRIVDKKNQELKRSLERAISGGPTGIR